MIVSLIWGLIAIVFSLSIPYEEILFYVKMFVWCLGWFLIGGIAVVSPVAGFVGGILLAVSFFFRTDYPLIFVSLFTGALGAILLGGSL